MANADLVKLAARHRENSYSTQRGRSAIVKMMANQLGDMGFNRLKAKNLKEKHALALIERWRGERLTAGTLKNRMAVLRWVYEKVGKSWMLAGRNAAYGIERRQYQTNVNKAREITVADPGADHQRARAAECRDAAALRAAARRGNEDPGGVGGPRRQPGAQGVVDQGRPRAQHSDPHRSAEGPAGAREATDGPRFPDPPGEVVRQSHADVHAPRFRRPAWRSCTGCGMPTPRSATGS